MIHYRQRSWQSQARWTGVSIRRRAKFDLTRAEHLSPRLELNMNLEPDGRNIIHCASQLLTQRTQKSQRNFLGIILFQIPIDDSLDTIFQVRLTEIKQQS